MYLFGTRIIPGNTLPHNISQATLKYDNKSNNKFQWGHQVWQGQGHKEVNYDDCLTEIVYLNFM